MTYKHIMVAVDGSSTSILALEEAIKLAKEQKAKIRIIHVINELYEGDVDRNMFIALRKEEGEKVLNQMSDLARKSNVLFDIHLAEMAPSGGIGEKVVAEAQAWLADLVVIGTHGRSGISHALMGSVAESVTRNATTPILLIKSK